CCQRGYRRCGVILGLVCFRGGGQPRPPPLGADRAVHPPPASSHQEQTAAALLLVPAPLRTWTAQGESAASKRSMSFGQGPEAGGPRTGISDPAGVIFPARRSAPVSASARTFRVVVALNR